MPAPKKELPKRAGGAAHQRGHVVVVLGLLDAIEVRLERLGVELLGGGVVEEGAIDRRDLGFVGAGLQALVGAPLVEQRMDAGLGEIAEDGEGAVAGLVGRNLSLGEPRRRSRT